MLGRRDERPLVLQRRAWLLVTICTVGSMTLGCEMQPALEGDTGGNPSGSGGSESSGDFEWSDSVNLNVSPTAGQEGCVLHCDTNLGIVSSLPDDLCEAIAVADTVYFSHCASSMLLTGVDPSDYSSLLRTWCNRMHFYEGLPGQVPWDASLESAYKSCLVDWLNKPCGCPAECTAVDTVNGLVGTLADGEPCQQNTQCQSGICVGGLNECGVCTAPDSELPLGGVCEWDYDCENGLYCEENTLLCTPEKALCDACTDDSECGPLYACVHGECAWPYLVEGESCEDSSGGCLLGLQCRDIGENGASICARAKLYVGLGEPCNTDVSEPYSMETECGDFAYCSAEENGVCLERGEEGDPCAVDGWNRSTCMPFLSCVDSICVYPDLSCK